jgi:FMN-binding domain
MIASILAWASHSSRVLALLCLACGAAFADTVYQTRDDFLREVFGTPPPAQVLWLDNNVQSSLKEALGHPYGQARLRYWRKDGKTAWVLDEIGKEYPITAGFVVGNNTIDTARVLVYRETRGMEVRYPSFLQQFTGARLLDGRLSKPIDGISGATLSVQSMVRMARAALVLNERAP